MTRSPTDYYILVFAGFTAIFSGSSRDVLYLLKNDAA